MELSGEAGAGKTQFCLSLISDVVAKGLRASFLDTENCFHSERLEEILLTRHPKLLNIEEALHRVQVYKIETIHDFNRWYHVFLSILLVLGS